MRSSSKAGYLGRSTALQPRLQKRLKATIVVVHGFMNTSESTLPLARHLYDAGYRVCNFEYASELGTIAQHTNSLLEYVDASVRGRRESVHFVTHSLGGLILRSALNHKDCPSKFKQGAAVMIAPPMNGTQFGRYLNYLPYATYFAGEKSGKELLETEAFGFDYLGPFPESLRVLLVLGEAASYWEGCNPFLNVPNDGKVEHHESYLTTPFELRVVRKCCHSTVNSQQETLAATVEFFNSIEDGSYVPKYHAHERPDLAKVAQKALETELKLKELKGAAKTDADAVTGGAATKSKEELVALEEEDEIPVASSSQPVSADAEPAHRVPIAAPSYLSALYALSPSSLASYLYPTTSETSAKAKQSPLSDAATDLGVTTPSNREGRMNEETQRE